MRDERLAAEVARAFADCPEHVGQGLAARAVDALELIVLLQQQYQIKLSNAEDGPKVFRSVRTIAAYITEHQAQNN